ncbi:MAG: GldG family protein [Lachnospiraceae bacterium]|jgi:ABC-2 type transport system permease protein
MKKINLKRVNVKQYFENRKKQQKSIRNGSYSMGITAVVIAIVVVLNLVVQEIPVQYRKFDLSETNLYSIGDQTKNTLENLDQDVTLYLIVEEGSESADIQNLLERYESVSDHITVETKDPVLNPNFTAQYTQESVENNSIIVVCGERSKLITYSSMLETSVDYTTYSTTVTGFDGEGQITSAIDYVTSEDLPTMYVVEGHNEAAMSDTLTSSVQKENINIESLNLLTQESVPEDADCIFIFAPTTDFSEEETSKVLEYLENGGKAIIISSYMQEKLQNFQSIVENYGVTICDGIVVEGDSDYYIANTPFYLLPEMGDNDITSSFVQEGRHVLVPYAQGIQITDDSRSTLSIDELLLTSDNAYSKVNVEETTTMEKEEGDIEGPFAVGVSITEPVSDEKETQIVLFSTESLLDDNVNANVSGNNYELFTSCLSWMCESEPSVSIGAKDITLSNLTIPASDIHMWSIFSIGVLPVIVLFIGGVIWFKRRKQ